VLKYRATSTRVSEGHGSNFFTNSPKEAYDWARHEAKTGYDAKVFIVEERMVEHYEAKRCKVCKNRLQEDTKQCAGCGRPA
jgi:hypothetical protein